MRKMADYGKSDIGQGEKENGPSCTVHDLGAVADGEIDRESLCRV